MKNLFPGQFDGLVKLPRLGKKAGVRGGGAGEIVIPTALPGVILVPAETTGWTLDDAAGFVLVGSTLHGIGDAGFYSSTNGLAWTRDFVITTGGDTPIDLAVGAGFFLTGGNNGNRVYTSPTGQTWTQRNLSPGQQVQAVLFANSLFVVVGGIGSAAVSSFSSDGISWSNVNIAFAGTQRARDVAFGVGLFVCVGGATGAGTIFSSPDASTWTQRHTTSQHLRGITFAAGRFIACGDNSIISVSTDGINWTDGAVNTIQSFESVETICGTPSGFYACITSGGAVNGRVYYSVNGGTSWTFLKADSGSHFPFGRSTVYASSINSVIFGSGQ